MGEYINISEREYLKFIERNPDGRPENVPLSLILIDGSTYPKEGKFNLMNRQVDTTTGTFKVGALFPNPDGHLRPGQFAKVRAAARLLCRPARRLSERAQPRPARAPQ